ncbi:MAG: PilN domain-containing protein [Hyphomicrobiaceae bacterium]
MNQIAASVGAFLRWWGGQLRDLAPVGGPSLSQAQAPRLVLSVSGGRGMLERQAAGATTPIGDGQAVAPEALAVLLAEAGTSRLPVGLRVPLSDCLERRVDLPGEARARFAEILRLDLERATPFRASDVLSGFVVPPGRTTGGMVRVRQLVLRRDKVAPWLAALDRLGQPAQFIDCRDETTGEVIPVNLLAGETADSGTLHSLGARAALLAACLALAGASLWTWSSRQAAALDAVRADTAVAREKAVRAQRTLDGAVGTLGDLGALRQLTTGPVSVTEVVDTLSRLIPDQASLQDLRIEAGVIEMSGLAQNAAALLPLLERSAIFTEASFTAPVLLDPTVGKERFSIRLRMRPAPQPPGARP